MRWDGMGWDGMRWDGMGWDGMGWDGMVCLQCFDEKTYDFGCLQENLLVRLKKILVNFFLLESFLFLLVTFLQPPKRIVKVAVIIYTIVTINIYICILNYIYFYICFYIYFCVFVLKTKRNRQPLS